MRDKASAKEWALQCLQSGKVIDHPQAIIGGHGWRLAARIYDLRKEGHRILTARGSGGIAKYHLPDDRQLDLFAGEGPAATGPDHNGETAKEDDHAEC
ncbi:MAG: helix-turn-helix domain-containing protein [Acidithiobacillus sp.]|nr:helix-turn-helix domain-containing protein [Acidithiobacillus sp.]